MMNISPLAEQIRIVFFDIDETLFMKNENHLPESVLPALMALKQKGVIPAIATGRARCSFPKKINELIEQVGMNVFVTMNGQMVTVDGKIIERHPIPTEKIEQLTAFFDRHGIDYAFVCGDSIRVSAVTPKVKTALDPITTDYAVDKDFYRCHEVYQMLPFYDESQDDLIRQAAILDGLKVVRWHPDSVDLFDVEGSKARGILAAIRALGIDIGQVMAFGDGLNDIEMLTTVGHGVAMGNAHPTLKQLAKHHTSPIHEHGIAHFLRDAGLI